MNSTIPFLAFTCLALLGACRSAGSRADLPCICGTDEAVLEGCAHELCLSGLGNPENPECVCGPLEFEEVER